MCLPPRVQTRCPDCDVLQVKRLGQHHPDVATTLAATAGLLKAMGRMADAETVYRLVRAVKAWQLGQNQPARDLSLQFDTETCKLSLSMSYQHPHVSASCLYMFIVMFCRRPPWQVSNMHQALVHGCSAVLPYIARNPVEP